MTKPVPARATGYFHERPAPPFLRGTFSCTWIHRMPEASGVPIIVAPDGTIDLQWIDGIFRVAGPDKDPMIEILPAATTVVGFRFQPAAAAAWLGVPASQILGQRLSLQELWGPRARRLAAKVREHRNIAELTAALENANSAEFDPRTPDPVISTMADQRDAGQQIGIRLIAVGGVRRGHKPTPKLAEQ